MFKNVFQGGPSVEIFSSQGKDPLGKWKVMGQSSIQKVFEKEVKSYVHILGGASTTTKIQLPKDTKQTLVLIQRYLVLQLFVPLGKDFSIEISVSDMSNNKRRLLFSTAQREIAATPLHAKVPLTILKRAVWLNMCIDMFSIVGEAFRGQTYKSLDSLTISAACHLRKVFTMKCQLPDDTDDDDLYDCKPSTNENELDGLPKTFHFAPDVSYQTQVLTMTKLKCAEAKLRGEHSRPPSSTETDLNSSMKGKQDDKPMHIAFGSKVPVPSTASGKRITSSTGAREGSSGTGNRTSRSSHSRSQRNDDSVPSARGKRSARDREQLDVLVLSGHMRQKSDPGTEISPDSGAEKGTLSGSKTWSPGTGGIAEELASIKPHPPRQKSGDKSRRVIRVRPSSGKDRESSDARSRSNSGTTRRGGTYERRKYSQDQASEESSDADAMQRLSDSAIMKNAAARIRTESISEDEEPVFEKSAPKNQVGSKFSVRTKLESYSESDDVLRRSSNNNPASVGRGKVQRRKKKPERERLDSYSETEEIQQTSRYRNGGNSSSRRGSKGDRRLNGSQEAQLNARKNRKGSGSELDPTHANRLANSRYSQHVNEEEEDEDCTPRQNDRDQEEQGKIYTFQSPPRKAPMRTAEISRQLDPKKLQMQLEKISLSSHGAKPTAVAIEMPSSARGAELEADFLKGNVSTEDEPIAEGNNDKLLTSKERYRSIIARTPSPRLVRSPKPGDKSPGPGQRSPVGTEQCFKEHENRNSTSAADQGPLPAKGSPTLRRSKLGGNRGGGDQLEKIRDGGSTPLQKSLARSVSRCSVSSKKLKEIPKDDPRLSLSDEYDWRKYQSNSSSLASSMEATMLASLRRQQLEEMFEEEGENNPANNSFDVHNYGDDDLSDSSDDTTATFGTFKQPELSKRFNRYQDEMHFPANGNPLLQSNPRDWGEPFSPPIVLPSEKMRDEMDSTGMFLGDQHSPNKDGSAGMLEFGRNKSTSSEEHGSRQTESTSDGHDEDELDLLYDPCLNCYFDPKSGKYYELK